MSAGSSDRAPIASTNIAGPTLGFAGWTFGGYCLDVCWWMNQTRKVRRTCLNSINCFPVSLSLQPTGRKQFVKDRKRCFHRTHRPETAVCAAFLLIYTHTVIQCKMYCLWQLCKMSSISQSVSQHVRPRRTIGCTAAKNRTENTNESDGGVIKKRSCC